MTTCAHLDNSIAVMPETLNLITSSCMCADKYPPPCCRQLENAKELSLAEQSLVDISKAQQLAKTVSEAAPKAVCFICGDECSRLEGLACPANEHFLCNDCFSDWVLSQSTPADDHVPKDAGEIWCARKADVHSTKDCKSERPFSPRVRAPCMLHPGQSACVTHNDAQARRNEKSPQKFGQCAKDSSVAVVKSCILCCRKKCKQ